MKKQCCVSVFLLRLQFLYSVQQKERPQMLVAFWKAATSFPDFFVFSKTIFLISFLRDFSFAFVAFWKSAISFPAFFFFFCIFKNEFFFFHFLLSVSFAFVTFWKASSPFLSFFHFFYFLLITIFFRDPFSRQPFQMGTNEESSKYLDNKLVKNCSFLLSSKDVVTHRESWI